MLNVDLAPSFDVSQVSLALFSGAFTIAVAWVAFRGKTDETFANQTKALIDGQAIRVKALEDRLDSVTLILFSTQKDYYSEVSKSSMLAGALDLSVCYLESVEDSLRVGEVPEFPRLKELRELLDEYKDTLE